MGEHAWVARNHFHNVHIDTLAAGTKFVHRFSFVAYTLDLSLSLSSSFSSWFTNIGALFQCLISGKFFLSHFGYSLEHSFAQCVHWFCFQFEISVATRPSTPNGIANAFFALVYNRIEHTIFNSCFR